MELGLKRIVFAIAFAAGALFFSGLGVGAVMLLPTIWFMEGIFPPFAAQIWLAGTAVSAAYLFCKQGKKARL
jgi:hypothetical protein